MAYRTLNPFTEEMIKEFPPHTEQQVEAALAKADALYRSTWSQGDRAPRLAVLQRLAELLSSNRDELARVMALEMGKPLNQGVIEADLCAGIAKYYSENAADLLKARPVKTEAGDAWVEFHPIGILVAVEPWNFPIYQLTRVIIPAIAVGNPVIYKHASIVPQCAALFEKIVRDAGAPEGAVTNLYISASKVSELIGDPRVQGVALTGSEGAGSKVAARAGEMLKKSTMELGGADIFAVLDDADVAKAVQAGVMARLINAGQMCSGAKRFIVQRKISEAFIGAFVGAMQSVALGDPTDPQTVVGPMASEEGRNDLAKQVEDAVRSGAKVLTGGKAPDRKGFFYEPTVLIDISRDNPAYYQEFFGPVAQVHVVDTDDELVALANDSNFGLGGAIFSSNIERARSLASRIETGSIYINTLNMSRPELPFGGVKRSGYGRELGEMGIMEFVNRKLVVVSA